MEEPIVSYFSARKAARRTTLSVPLPASRSTPWGPAQDITDVARFDTFERFNQDSFSKITEYQYDIRMGLGGTMLAFKFPEGISTLLVEDP